MAKMVNCEHLIDDNPCNECASCLSVSSGSDIIEIDALQIMALTKLEI